MNLSLCEVGKEKVYELQNGLKLLSKDFGGHGPDCFVVLI